MPAEQRAHAGQSVRRHLDLGYAYLEPRDTGRAVLVCGTIGTGKTTTVNRLWQQVAELAGITLEPEHQDARQGDILHSVAAIDAARRDLGFVPEIRFQDGLAQTYAWYQRQ